MSSLTNRLKALEEAVAEIVEASKAASDPNRPIPWGRGLEGMADTAIAYDHMIESLCPETQQAQRIKCFGGLAFSFHWVMWKINRDRSKLEALGPERIRGLCRIILVYGAKFKELGQQAKSLLNERGHSDTAKLKAYLDSGSFAI